MYTVNTAIAFTFILQMLAAAGTAPATISLLLIGPDGTATYDADGTGASAVYVLPTDLAQGSYDFTHTFTTPGTWRVVLADGVAGAYDELFVQYMSIIEGETAFVNTIAVAP